MKVIAYGSLMSQTSLESTLGRRAGLTAVSISGWKRVFNAPFDGYAFLNLKRESDASIEAAFFELGATELPLFAEREAGSELLEVMTGYYAFVWPEHYCQNLPALRSYIQLCEQSATRNGLDFSVGLEYPVLVIDDLAKPLYT
jgi:hypothetical protein